MSVRRAGVRDELVVRIEVADADGNGGDSIPPSLRQRLREVWRVNPDRVETVPVGTLAEGEKVLVDDRPWDG